MKKGILKIAVIILFIGTVLLPVCNAFSQPNTPSTGIDEQPDEQNKDDSESQCLWDYGPYLKATVKGTLTSYYEDFRIFGYSFKPHGRLGDIWVYPSHGEEEHIAPTEGRWTFSARLAKWDVFEEIGTFPDEKYYVEGTVIWCVVKEFHE